MSIIYSTQQDRHIDTDYEELEKVDYNWDIPTLKKMAQRIKREEDRIAGKCTCQYDQASRYIDESGLQHSKNCSMSDEQLSAEVLEDINTDNY